MTAAAILLAASASHAAITGTIIGVDGKPLAGATIQAYPAETSAAQRARLLSSSPERAANASVQSSENGTFSIDPKSPLADLIVSISGRAAAAIEVPDGEDAGVIVVSPQSHRTVRVTGDGKPVPNALVADGSLTVRTNAQGEADLPELLLGRPVAVQSGFAPAEEPIGESRPVLALDAGVTVSGKVVAADGSPAAHSSVSVDGWPLGETNGAGEFTIAHAPKNWRRITAIRDSRIGEAPNKGRSITIRLTPAVTISGNTVPGARVTLRRPADFSVFESIISDAKGAFAFPPVAPGDYTLLAARFGDSFTDRTISANKNIVESIEAKPFVLISGRVVDEQRAPVAGALMMFGNRSFSSGGAMLSGPNGEFKVRGNFAAPFPQSVVAIHNGYAAGASPAMNSDSAKSGITVTLPRGFPFIVRVVDKQRQPVADASIAVFMASPDSMLRSPVVCEPALSIACHTTDASGSATYRATENTYSVNVRGETIASRLVPPQTFTARLSPLTIQVDRGVVVAGHVMYRDGTPVVDAMVMPKIGAGAMARTNPDGSFELRSVVPGPLSLIARTPNSAAPSASVDVTAPDNNVTLTLATPGRIEGRVTDKATGQPVTDFGVAATLRDMRFYGPGMRAKQFHSDDGAFAIDDAPLGAVTVRVSAPGYSMLTNDVNVQEGKTVSDVAFPLEHGGRIVGRVTADDQPLAGVSIRVGNSDPTTASTDADGQYTIDSIAAGDRMVEFAKSGFIAQHKSVDVTAGKDARLDVTMSRGRDLVGRVVDANGQAIVNARLFIRSGGRPLSGMNPNTFTDGDGQFKFEGLRDGHYSVSATKDGFVGAAGDGDVPSTTPVTITMKTGGTITGRVVGLSEAELANAYVYGASPSGSAHAQVDAGGTFTLRGVPDGNVSVSATAGGMSARRSPSKTVEVTNGIAAPVEIDFAQGLTITGHVTQNGSPVSGGNVTFSPKSGSQFGSSQISGDSSYSVTGLEPGEYTVRVFSYGGARYETAYTVSGSTSFDIDMKGATLEGHVLDASTGEPVSDANVWAQGPKDSKYTQGTTSGSDGRFVLTAVPDGSVTLHATREKYSALTQTVVVASGTAPDTELRLDRGQEAVILIVDAPSGNPVSGYASIYSGRKSVGSAVPGDDGKAHVWLPPGAYKASVSAPDYVSMTIDLTVPGPEVRATLSRAGKLVITSRSTGDVQISLAGLPLETPGVGGVITGKRMAHVQANAQAVIGGLAAGHYTVDLLNSDRVTVKQSYSVDVFAGQTAQLNIE